MFLKISQNSNFLRTPFYIEHLGGCFGKLALKTLKRRRQVVLSVDVVLVSLTLKKVSSGLLFVLYGLVSSVLYTFTIFFTRDGVLFYEILQEISVLGVTLTGTKLKECFLPMFFLYCVE